MSDVDLFESIYVPGKQLLLLSWRDGAAAAAFRPQAPGQGDLRHRIVRVVRDYGLFDRRDKSDELEVSAEDIGQTLGLVGRYVGHLGRDRLGDLAEGL